MQINRLLETVYLLLDKKNMTAGIPVYAAKGKGGGSCRVEMACRRTTG